MPEGEDVWKEGRSVGGWKTEAETGTETKTVAEAERDKGWETWIYSARDLHHGVGPVRTAGRLRQPAASAKEAQDSCVRHV